MSIYTALHPEVGAEEIQEDFDIEEEDRKLSVFDILCIWGRMTDGVDESDAIRKYMEMHPESNEADVRAELEKAIAEDE
jgi:hypothetical protein